MKLYPMMFSATMASTGALILERQSWTPPPSATQSTCWQLVIAIPASFSSPPLTHAIAKGQLETAERGRILSARGGIEMLLKSVEMRDICFG